MLISYWLELCHVAISSYKGSWEVKCLLYYKTWSSHHGEKGEESQSLKHSPAL